MRPASHSIWALVGASGYLSAVARAAGILDVGLAFPRTNATYSPAEDFPVVFAVQNSKLAEHLKLAIEYQVLNMTGDIQNLVWSTSEVNWTSASEHDPYLLWDSFNFEGEGKLRILWHPLWKSCDQNQEEVALAHNETDNFLVDFEIRASGEKADLVATNNGDSENCPNGGVAIDVTDKTLEATNRFSEQETCAVLGSSSPTPISNPCKVKIDKTTVDSMAAAILEEKCRGPWPPSECPKDSLASRRFAVTGVATLAAVLGAALFLA